MQDDQKGQKTMVLPSAEKTSLTRFVLSKKIFLVANGLVWQLMVTPLWSCLGIQDFYDSTEACHGSLDSEGAFIFW
jgi:hypothetical protein